MCSHRRQPASLVNDRFDPHSGRRLHRDEAVSIASGAISSALKSDALGAPVSAASGARISVHRPLLCFQVPLVWVKNFLPVASLISGAL